MAQEIYHRSEWGNPNEQWGNVYLNADLTNELYKRASEYENSWVTDQLLNGVGTKPSIILTPTAYEDGVLNSVKPSNGDGDFSFSRGTSATRVNEQGLVENVTNIPRIDYVNDEGSILLEPQRTNVSTYSEDFSQWSAINGAVVTDNFTTSPDGTQNAAKIVYDGTSLGRIEISTSATGTNTQSIYLKTASGTQNVSIGALSSDLTEVTVTDEWQRFTHTGLGNTPRVLCNDASTIYVWGGQLESGSYATSYIPTTSDPVTRLKDVCLNSGNSDLINSTEGVLYAEISALANDSTFRYISLNNGSNTNVATIFFSSGAANVIRAIIISGGVTYVDIQYTVSDFTEFNKVALKYKANDFSLWINGVERATDTSGSTPVGLDSFDLGLFVGGNFEGNVKCLAVFKEALSDTELEHLTTI